MIKKIPKKLKRLAQHGCAKINNSTEYTETLLMTHNVPLISTIAIAFGLAFVLGLMVAKIKISPIVGYLLAGILIGPFTPGFVGDIKLAKELSEIGVMLLMFGVGLHFSLDDLISVRKIAVPGAVLQILVATALGASIAYVWGFSLPSAIIFGLALSVASTVVLLRALEAHGALESMDGRIAVGWLVVEDIVMLLILVLLPSISNWHSHSQDYQQVWGILGITLFKISIFVGFMLIIGRKIFPKLLWFVAKIGSRELFTLCVVATAISIAYLAARLFDVSFALGAFFSGMIMRESELSHRAAEESLPLRDAFAVLFFVSVGMLFDPKILITEPLRVLAVVSIILVGKSIAAASLVAAFRYPINTALTVAVSLAQIGEFSFILAAVGVSLGLLSMEAQNLILAGAFISIAINPFLFAMLKPVGSFIEKHFISHKKDTGKITKNDGYSEISDEKKGLSKHVILIGNNTEMELQLIDFLKNNDISHVVLNQPKELMEELKKQTTTQNLENPAEQTVLKKAGISKAKILLIFETDSFNTQHIIYQAKLFNPKIKILLCIKDTHEMNLFEHEKSVKILTAEKALIQSVSEYLSEKYKRI